MGWASTDGRGAPTAEAEVDIAGALAKPLDAVTSSANAKVDILASLSKQLEGLASAIAVAVDVDGRLRTEVLKGWLCFANTSVDLMKT